MSQKNMSISSDHHKPLRLQGLYVTSFTQHFTCYEHTEMHRFLEFIHNKHLNVAVFLQVFIGSINFHLTDQCMILTCLLEA